MLLATGCSSLFPNKTPQAQNTQSPSPPFSMVASTDGTFLVNQSNGKVWRFDAKQGAFLEVPVTSKIETYGRNPKTGQLELQEELNNSGKPCDKKLDPLCIL
jgi:hypothetical protein